MDISDEEMGQALEHIHMLTQELGENPTYGTVASSFHDIATFIHTQCVAQCGFMFMLIIQALTYVRDHVDDDPDMTTAQVAQIVIDPLVLEIVERLRVLQNNQGVSNSCTRFLNGIVGDLTTYKQRYHDMRDTVFMIRVCVTLFIGMFPGSSDSLLRNVCNTLTTTVRYAPPQVQALFPSVNQ